MAEGKPFVKTGQLIDCENAFEHNKANDLLFDQAMREALDWHLKKCPAFRAFMFASGLPRHYSDLSPEDFPPVLVTIFKEFRLASVSEDKVKIELTSSGTGGRKSAIILDNRSYKRIRKIVHAIFASLGMVNPKTKVNYLCFTYDPKKAGNVGTAFSDQMLTGLTGRRTVFYAIRWNDKTGDFEFDLDATVRKLKDFNKRAEPVRILGFPAYLWQVCDKLEEHNSTLNLGAESFIITGGGWKLHKDRQVSREVFKDRVERLLGIPGRNIRDLFGMVEHGIPYVECEKGRLHVPVYARARVLEPETLHDSGYNKPGLLHLMTPYLSSYPSISLLTTDVAIMENDCPCGRSGDTFRIVGRAGLAKHKGCAITALELLK